MNANASNEFDIIVKAATPRRKISTVVKALNVQTFQRQLVTLMQSQMFKDIKASAVVTDKKKKTKKTDDAKKVTIGGKRDKPDEKPVRAKKNRKDRRKDIRKDKRRDIKKIIKEDKLKLHHDNQDTKMKEE